MHNIHFVAFIGPQGSGKGTQAAALAQILRLPHVSTGAMFREELARGTELGKQVGVFMSQGKLVSDDIVNTVVAEFVAGKGKDGFILDGYPRSVPQAEFLASLAPELLVVELAMPDEVTVGRLAGRRQCDTCGKIFHLTFSPPRAADICDACGGKLTQRADDVPEKIRERLSSYRAVTEPVLEFYREQGNLVTVDATPAIPQVTTAVRAALGV